jgi:hypothetical protein
MSANSHYQNQRKHLPPTPARKLTPIIPAMLIHQLLDFIEMNLKTKISKIRKMSDLNNKKLRKVKADYENVRQKVETEVEIEKRKMETTEEIEENIGEGIKKYFRMMKQSTDLNKIPMLFDKNSVSANIENSRCFENSVISESLSGRKQKKRERCSEMFWRQSMSFKRTKSKPLLTTDSEVLSECHSGFLNKVRSSSSLLSNGKISPEKISVRKKRKTSNLRRSGRSKSIKKIGLGSRASRSRSKKSFSQTCEIGLKRRLKQTKKTGGGLNKKKSQRRLKSKDEGGMKRWERLYRLGVEKAQAKRKLSEDKEKEDKSRELNRSKSRGFGKLRSRRNLKKMRRKSFTEFTKNSSMSPEEKKHKKDVKIKRVPAKRSISRNCSDAFDQVKKRVERYLNFEEQNGQKEDQTLNPVRHHSNHQSQLSFNQINPGINGLQRKVKEYFEDLDSEESKNLPQKSSRNSHQDYFIGLLSHFQPTLSRNSEPQVLETPKKNQNSKKRLDFNYPGMETSEIENTSEAILSIYREEDRTQTRKHAGEKREIVFNFKGKNIDHENLGKNYTENYSKEFESKKEFGSLGRQPLREIKKLEQRRNFDSNHVQRRQHKLGLHSSQEYLSIEDETLRSYDLQQKKTDTETKCEAEAFNRLAQARQALDHNHSSNANSRKSQNYLKKKLSSVDFSDSSRLQYTTNSSNSVMRGFQNLEGLSQNDEQMRTMVTIDSETALAYSHTNRSGGTNNLCYSQTNRNRGEENNRNQQNFSFQKKQQDLDEPSSLKRSKKSSDSGGSNNHEFLSLCRKLSKESNLLDMSLKEKSQASYNTLQKEFLEISLAMSQKEALTSPESGNSLGEYSGLEDIKGFLLASTGNSSLYVEDKERESVASSCKGQTGKELIQSISFK